MKFSQKLFESYKRIRNCALIKQKIVNEKTIAEFESILNDAQPKTDDELYEFGYVKFYYNINKTGYKQCIANTNGECTVLWTESKFIVSWFRLNGSIYISYDPKTHLYSVQPHNNKKADRKREEKSEDDNATEIEVTV